MGTTTETRITSTQAKDAIYKAHSMPSADTINGVANRIKPQFTFIFDDSYSSHRTLVAPLFESYGFRCGFGITVSQLGDTGKMKMNDLIALSNQGHELLSQSFSNIKLDDLMDINIGDCEAEFSRQYLNRIQDIKGFTAPYSSVSDKHLNSIRKNYGYGFTVFKGNTVAEALTPITAGINPYKLWRLSVDAVTTSYIDNAINENIKQNGVICFYLHDVLNPSDSYTKLIYILDKVVSLGYSFSLPNIAINKVVGINKATNIPYFEKDLNAYVYTNWAANTLSQANLTFLNGAVSITSTVATSVLLVNYFILNEIVTDKLLTIEMEIDSTSADVNDFNLSLRTRKLDGTILETSEKYFTSQVNDNNRRLFKVSIFGTSLTERLMPFIRVDFKNIGDTFIIKNTRCYIGNSTK